MLFSKKSRARLQRGFHRKLFRIFLSAKAGVDLDAEVRHLQRSYGGLTVVEGAGSNFQTLQFLTTEHKIRKLLNSLPPKQIWGSYEEVRG